LRENKSNFFFGSKPDRISSYNWILSHRENKDDVLYQITHSKTGGFLGTIGFVNRGNEIELGRLAVYTKGVRQLLRSGESREEVGEVGRYASIALLKMLLQTKNFSTVYAEVLDTNILSNRLCNDLCNTVSESYKELYTGEKIKTYIYRITRKEIQDKYGNEEMDFFLT
jgi:hypothetical protein